MRRAIVLLLAGLFLATCSPAAAPSDASPARTPDIKRAKLDAAYSGLTDVGVFAPTSREVLTAALQAVQDEVKRQGGKADVTMPEFSNVSEPSTADFRKFADALGLIAAANPSISGDRLADVALLAMARVKPDCHTNYVRRSSATPGGLVALAVGAGSVSAADRSGLDFRVLPGGIGYLTWREWLWDGTYKQDEEVLKAMDQLLGQGARAWLFDVTNNPGGLQNQTMMSWFNKGEPIAAIRVKTGNSGTLEAKGELRLPDRYQLPIAVVINGRSASMSEMFAVSFKETKRGTVFGTKSPGCLGNTEIIRNTDGSVFQYTTSEMVGAVTGTTYNRAGVVPDREVPDAQAVEAAATFLRQRIAQGG